MIEESKNVYMDLFNSYPYLIEALAPLKTILKKQKKWEELEKIAFKFQESYDFNFYSKAKTFEILLWIDNKIYFDILNEINNDNKISDKNIEIILKDLINNNKIEELNTIIENLRVNRSVDYFSFQLGLHYSMQMEFEKSLTEYLLFLKHNPTKNKIIRNRIMAYPDIEAINQKIKKNDLRTYFNYA